MNTYLKKELFDKYLIAQSKNTQYSFNLDMDETRFVITVIAHHTRHHITASYTLAEYESFLHDDPMAEEKALNYAIAELNYFIKYPELKVGIRLVMYQDFLKKCREEARDTEWIADYLNLDSETVKGMSA